MACGIWNIWTLRKAVTVNVNVKLNVDVRLAATFDLVQAPCLGNPLRYDPDRLGKSIRYDPCLNIDHSGAAIRHGSFCDRSPRHQRLCERRPANRSIQLWPGSSIWIPPCTVPRNRCAAHCRFCPPHNCHTDRRILHVCTCCNNDDAPQFGRISHTHSSTEHQRDA